MEIFGISKDSCQSAAFSCSNRRAPSKSEVRDPFHSALVLVHFLQQFWAPHFKKDLTTLEGIQRTARRASNK